MYREKVSYLGPEGTFSEEAALTWSNEGNKVYLLPLSSFEDVVLAVEREEAQTAVLPLENSREGSVGLALDLLVKAKNLQIKGEVVIPVRHYLFVAKGIALGDIKEVHSHPQALGQCREFLRGQLKEYREVPQLSTAVAASEVASLGGVRAALAPYRNGEIYGLTPLLQAIPEGACNKTRFVFLGREDAPPTGKDKTSLLFTVDVGPGRLHKILEIFALKEINLTKIESRPAKKDLGDYIFFIDLEGHRSDPKISQALTEVSELVPFIKVLGSYPAITYA